MGKFFFRLLLLVLILLGGFYLWLRSSLPGAGEFQVAGIQAAVTITRDAHGIPTVTAQSERDAAFAVGFLHAQDRLFQMDLMRRFASGRLAEWFGERALSNDRFIRTLGLRQAANKAYAALSPDTQGVLEAYAKGANAALASRKGALPPEYYLLGAHPEPWHAVDSLLWGKLMAIQLAGNFRGELLRARLAQTLKPEDIDILYPSYPGDGPVSLGDAGPQLQGLDLDAIYAALPDLIGPVYASNNWVVDGKHSKTGKPLLANDPHLGLSAPGIWYLMAIKTPQFNMTGVTAPGVPFMVLGHNDRIGWGFTTTTGDVEDLYIEKIDPADPTHYLTPGGSAPFITRQEEILVHGGAPVDLTIRSTRHGPVISDLPGNYGAAAAGGTVLALQATWLMEDDHTPEALRLLSQAKDWNGFRDALRGFYAPQQNMVYADMDGNIGFIAPARIPIRSKGDGFMPVPGWTGEYEWKGFIPFEQLPSVYNPPSGRVVTANNKIVPDSYPFFISRDWDTPNRAIRINQLLDAAPLPSVDDFAAIQADTLSLMAKDLVPLMLKMLPGSVHAYAAVEKLKTWNFHMDRERIEPLLFAAWLREFSRLVLSEKLGKNLSEYGLTHPAVLHSILAQHPEWCDETSKSCGEKLSATLETALGQLSASYGDDMANWTWGRAHVAPFKNLFWANVPVIGRLFDIGIAADGGYDTVNRGNGDANDADTPYADLHGPALREILDFSALDHSRFSVTPGESANPLSSHYGDLVKPWRDFDWLDVDHAATVSRTRLVPAGAS